LCCEFGSPLSDDPEGLAQVGKVKVGVDVGSTTFVRSSVGGRPSRVPFALSSLLSRLFARDLGR
jgi:hypothetical protein